MKALLKRWFKELTLHHLFPFFYRRYAAGTGRPGRIVFLEEYGRKLSDNCAVMRKALEQAGARRLTEIYLGREDGGLAAAVRSFRALKALAQARCVLLSDSSELISCLPLREQTSVIQLWHACGAFKKFGYSLAGKKFGADEEELERFPRHRNFTYVTVSSREVAWAYAQAFRMEDRPEAIVPTGIARTDLFFDPDRAGAAAAALKECTGICAGGRRIVLYAPTFRGNVSGAASPRLPDFGCLHTLLGPDWVFLIKQHPYVKNRPAVPEEQSGYVFDLSEEMEIDALMMVSDVCISDYSSLVFEYSLLDRPMLFYAPDLEEYNDWRGFYYPYGEMTPGPVLRTTQELGDWLAHLDERFDKEQVRRFRERFMGACDGHAAQRILELIRKG